LLVLLISWGYTQSVFFSSIVFVEVVTLIGPSQFKKKTLGTPQNRSIEELPIGPSLYIYGSSTLGKICGILCGAIWEHLGEHIENLGAHVENVLGK